MTAAVLSPKVDPGAARWYRFYAMFSESFANGVIERAALPPGSLVADPWIGSGTTAAAAIAAGHCAAGIDINPVMVAVTRGRLLGAAAAEDCVRIAVSLLPDAAAKFTDDDPLLDWFAPRAAKAIRGWERAVTRQYPERRAPLESAFLLTALFDVAGEFAKPYRSKNPTWPKRPAAADRVNATATRITKAVRTAAARRATLCPEQTSATRTSIEVGTANAVAWPDASVDLILTSPPYCTRIDYAVTTGVELAVLGRRKSDVHSLRDQSMGTSTIRGSLPVSLPSWGRTCLDLLDRVGDHPSKSSGNYYLKTFLQYFDDLSRSLQEVARCLKTGHKAVVVVQDSVYKGILIDLPTIAEEMATALGLCLESRDEFPAVRNMRRVNTRSRAYLDDTTSTESVLWLVKSQSAHRAGGP